MADDTSVADGTRGAAVTFALKTLTLNGEEIRFSSAWLDVERRGLLTHWNGFVCGGGSLGLVDIPELQLVAETINGRQVMGKAIVETVDRSTGDFPLKGTGSLLVDGQELSG